jgi:hypothetical protein
MGLGPRKDLGLDGKDKVCFCEFPPLVFCLGCSLVQESISWEKFLFDISYWNSVGKNDVKVDALWSDEDIGTKFDVRKNTRCFRSLLFRVA